MIKNFKTNIILLALVMTGAIPLITSCEKEGNNAEIAQTNNKSSKVSDGYYHIANLVNGTIQYTFDMDSLIDLFNQTNDTLVMESFTILDSNLTQNDGMAEIKMVCYNVRTCETETSWYPIVKENGDYLYSTNSSNGNGTQVKCIAKKSCKQSNGSCRRKFDKRNNFIGCECTKSGTCVEGEFATDILEAIAIVLLALSTCL